MKKLLPLSLCLLLSSCIDPYMMDMSQANDPHAYNHPYGGGYGQQLPQQAQGRDLNALAYERGLADGQTDAQRRQSQNYNRYRTSRFDRSTELAYRDGYNDGFERSSSSLNNLNRPPAYGSGGGYVPPQPGSGYPQQSYSQPPTQTQPPPQIQERDAAYQQGYDYGLRDRTGGRVADPATHVGRYDPRKRSSFERGYYDGYNTRSSSSGGSAPSGSSGRFWSL